MMHADGVGPVLIVEDDRNTAALIKTYLEKEGFQTALVHDGEEALNMIKTSNPGFVILDIMLPKIDAAAKFLGCPCFNAYGP
jgi:DNA-binding response OmpR family regulator